MLAKDDPTALATHEATPAVSTCIPTHERGRRVRQDPIRFKNGLGEATEQLARMGHRSREINKLVSRGRGLQEGNLFWRHQSAGVAVFLAPSPFQPHRVPELVSLQPCTDPAALEEAELHQRSYNVVRPLFAQRRKQARSRFEALAGAGDARAAIKVDEIVRAAIEGRVDTLLLSEGETIWGRFMAEEGRVERHAAPGPDRTELADLATVRTLLNGGEVHLLPTEEMPRPLPMVASLRY